MKPCTNDGYDFLSAESLARQRQERPTQKGCAHVTTRKDAGLERDWSLIAGRLDWYPMADNVVNRMIDVMSLTLPEDQAMRAVRDVLLCLAVADIRGELSCADEHEWAALAMLANWRISNVRLVGAGEGSP